MSGRVVRFLTAENELDDAADNLSEHGGPDLAIRFLRDADRTFATLAGRPGIGTPYLPDDPRFAGLR